MVSSTWARHSKNNIRLVGILDAIIPLYANFGFAQHWPSDAGLKRRSLVIAFVVLVFQGKNRGDRPCSGVAVLGPQYPQTI